MNRPLSSAEEAKVREDPWEGSSHVDVGILRAVIRRFGATLDAERAESEKLRARAEAAEELVVRMRKALAVVMTRALLLMLCAGACGAPPPTPEDDVQRCLESRGHVVVSVTPEFSVCSPSAVDPLEQFTKGGVGSWYAFQATFDGQPISGKVCCDDRVCSLLKAKVPDGWFHAWVCERGAL